MANGIKFSQTYNAVRQRIKKIPHLAEGVADMQRKGDANDLISTWRAGIQNNTLDLLPLMPKTIQSKKRLSYRYPSNPLYGLGLDGAKTYIKGMRVFKKKNGYVVRMINGKHHKSKLTLSSLFIVHEYGTTIRTKSGATISIPARPAMQKSYARVLRRLKARDPSKEFKAAINEYIKTGKNTLIKKIESRATEGEARNV